MKKLSLEMLRLTSEEVLGRSHMKKIAGGYGETDGQYKCCTMNGGCSGCGPCTSSCTCPLGTLTKC